MAIAVADREPRTREERGEGEVGERRTSEETETTGAVRSTEHMRRHKGGAREKSRKSIERKPAATKRMSYTVVRKEKQL